MVRIVIIVIYAVRASEPRLWRIGRALEFFVTNAGPQNPLLFLPVSPGHGTPAPSLPPEIRVVYDRSERQARPSGLGYIRG